MSLHYVVKFFSVMIEVHDALWLLGNPEFIKLIRKITWKVKQRLKKNFHTEKEKCGTDTVA